MLRPILIGICSAVVVFFTQYLTTSLYPSYRLLILALFCLGIVAASLEAKLSKRSVEPPFFSGLANLLIHILSPSGLETVAQWAMRGGFSFLLALCGGIAGTEGAAMEWTQAVYLHTRTRSARWFELKRRTDAASSLAAGISAAFGAPFAGVLLPMELGIGGRGQTVMVSSIAAFLMIEGLHYAFPSTRVHFDILGFAGQSKGLSRELGVWVLAIGVIAGMGGTLAISFVRLLEEGLTRVFKNRSQFRIVGSGALLILLLFVYTPASFSPRSLLLSLALGTRSQSELGLLFFTKLTALGIAVAGFGTLGIFWPLFLLGSGLAVFAHHAGLSDLGIGLAPAAIVGGASFLAVVMDTPLTGALIGFELTQNSFILGACLVSSYLGREIRRRFQSKSLMEQELTAQGVYLQEGRSLAVMESLRVADAMVTDQEEVYQHETVAELYEKIQKSKYPFFVVVNAQSVFEGLLTVDTIMEGWKQNSGILEAKDLLYRSHFKSQTVRDTDFLSVTSQLFEEVPCVPVLNEQSKVVGLLFVHQVRLAYDREVARRSFLFMREGKE